MPSAILSAEEWAEVKAASEAGMDDDELAQTYGVLKNAIQQRKYREKWLTPRKMKEMAMVQEAKDKARSMTNSVAVRDVSEEKSAMAVMSAKIAKLKEETPLMIAERASELIMEGLKTLLAPKGWKEMAIAQKVFNDATGLNKGGGMVIQVGGAAWGGSPQTSERPQIVTIKAEEA